MVLKLKEEFDKRYKTLTMCVDMSEAYKTYIAENGLVDNSIEHLKEVVDSFLHTNKKISEELSTLAILKLAQPVFAFISEPDITVELIEKLENIYTKLQTLTIECLELVELEISKRDDSIKLIPGEFYATTDGQHKDWIWIIHVIEIDETKTDNKIKYSYQLVPSGNLKTDDFTHSNWIKATPEQKQLLIDKVKEFDGKIFDEETKSFNISIAKEILVPKNIKIIKYQNEQLGIIFPNNKQVLTFDTINNIYQVQTLDKLDKPIKCELIKTYWKDIKIGECIFIGDIKSQINMIDLYVMKYTEDTYLHLSNDKDNNYSEIFIDDGVVYDCIVYKIVPIK